MSGHRMLLLWAILMVPACSYGQVTSRPEPRLAYRFEKIISGSKLDELLISIADTLQEQGTVLAIRVCSNKPMQVALDISTASPFAIANFMVFNYKYDPTRILFLRSQECLSGDANSAATELWIIPKGADAPPSVDSVHSCQAYTKPMIKGGFSRNIYDFRVALRRLVLALRERPEALGVIKGFYYEPRGRPRLTVKQSLREARKLLSRSELSSDRYLIYLVPWVNEWSLEHPEPAYPAVFTIEIAKTCDQVNFPRFAYQR